MLSTLEILVLLLAVIAGGRGRRGAAADPAAILLVLTGVVLALIPGLPTVELAPELVLLLVLPPVIYSSAVAMSWREFRFNLRPISLLAVGCVVFTTIAVAAATHWLLGLPWAVGFVLGAIVSPPDAWRRSRSPAACSCRRRLLVVLEGEGLAQRRDGAHPLSLRRRGGQRRRVLARRGRRRRSRPSSPARSSGASASAG